MASTAVTIMVDPRGVVPTPDHVDYATWQALPKELRGAYLQRSLAIARADGEKAEQDVAFWERTYRITRGVATFGISEAWDTLTAKLRQYRADRQAAAASIATMEKIASDPKYVGKIPADVLAGLQATKNELAASDAGVISALGPLSNIPDARQEAGLGAIPAPVLIVGAIAVGVAAVAVSATLIVIAQVKDRANARTDAFLKTREQLDRQDYEQGRISEEQFVARRAANVQQAAQYNASQDVNIGAGLLKPILVAGGVALVGYLAYRLIKRRSASAAPAA
jgi:hypothetical protein